MSTITFLLLTVAILQTIFAFPIEPRRWGHQIDDGLLTSEYVPGFVGERPITGPDGDYVRATFCYCKTASPDLKKKWLDDGNRDGQHTGGGNGIQPGEIVQGHYWRYEYFNYHNNATYWLNHYCMEDAFPKDEAGCGYDAPGMFEPTPRWSPWNTWQNDWVFTYSPIPDHDLHSWEIIKAQLGLDFIAYGRGLLWTQQKRRLDAGQGMINMPDDYVVEKCTDYCDKELLLPMDPTVKSHGELYRDVDDMCDRCR